MNCFRSFACATLLVFCGRNSIFAEMPTPELIRAIKTGDQEKAGLLLKEGADPNARDGVIPVIETAAYLGREKIVLMLLTSGADFRAADNDGFNALHAGALGGHRSIVKLLLDRGLAVNGQAQSDGMTPLAYASVRGHLEVIRLLLECHADVNFPDSGGNTPLLHAAMRGRAEAVRLLLAHGANVNTASAHGWTPLMTAAWEGHTDVVKDLLKQGANPHVTNVQGHSAFSLAASAGYVPIAKLLSESDHVGVSR